MLRVIKARRHIPVTAINYREANNNKVRMKEMAGGLMGELRNTILYFKEA